MVKFGVGQGVPRWEDPRLLRGGGRYSDDLNRPGQAHGQALRSPHAHARIVSIDTTAAKAAPGVLAVYTGDDIAAAGLGNIPCAVPRHKPDGSAMFTPPHPALKRDRVRLVGEREVGHEPSLAAQQPGVLGTRYRLAEAELTHVSRLPWKSSVGEPTQVARPAPTFSRNPGTENA